MPILLPNFACRGVSMDETSMHSWKIPSLMQKATPVAAAAVCMVWIAGQILKDRTWLTGLMFYFPTPVLVGCLLLLAGISVKRWSSRWKWYSVLVVVPLVFLGFIENHWWRDSTTDAGGTTLRLVHWNLCRTALGWDAQRKLIESLKPDILVLSETTTDVEADDFPGFEVLQIQGMLIASRGQMTASGSLVPKRVLEAFQIHCELPTGPLDVLIADMTSNVNIHRDLYLQPLLKVMQDQQPDLIVGDFNAPRRSLAFSSLPEGFQHAYDAAGAGWSYTWPVPVPFLAIDQCILGPKVTATNYQLRSTLLSDHRIQILDFQL